jgi:hypothetical protein
MRGRVRTWTEQQLREAVAKHASFSETLRALGLRPAGGNFRTMKLHVARLGLDTSHFTREAQIAALRASHVTRDWSLADVFREHSRVRGTGLRTRALAMVQPLTCAMCGNAGEWQGKPLTLQLDHVNGKYDDNRLENLRWLCPNCHSQTETFAGRGSVRRVRESAPRRYRVRFIGAGALAGASRASH